MTRKALCPVCGNFRRITFDGANYFHCCGIRWRIDKHLSATTETMDIKPIKTTDKIIGKVVNNV